MESSIFLLDKEEWGGLGRLRLPDLSRFEMFVYKGLTCLHLLQVHGISFGYLRNESLLQVYSMIKGSLRGKLSLLWFVEDFGIFGVLGRELLLYFFCSLS